MGQEASKDGSKAKGGKRPGKGGSKGVAANANGTAAPGKDSPEKPVGSAGAGTESVEDENDEDNLLGNDETVYSKNKKKVTQQDFDLLKVIGKGSFGKVMLVRKKDDGAVYAMKVLRKDAIIKRRQIAHTQAERDILTKLKHPFIVNLNYAFQTRDKLFMILDFVNGGELFFHLKNEGRFSEARVKLYVAEITAAMEHCHSLGVVYRDIKPENILLDKDGHICITDFGLCKQIDDGGTKTFCGTPEYLAPEVLKGKTHGMPVDWWSLGTLAYEMLTGLPPYYSQNINEMYEKILYDPLTFPAFLSAECKSFLEGLLTREPEKRLGSNGDGEEVRNHPWLREFELKKLLNKEYVPEFKPSVSSAVSTENVDAAFLEEEAADSHVPESALTGAGDEFEGFTFVQESAVKGGKK